MARIYRTTDRVEVKLGEITVKIAPLSLEHKNHVQKLMLDGQKNQDLQKLNDALLLAVKHCLKDIKGVQDSDGNDYHLEFNEGLLTDNCINDLLNMEESQNLLKVCSAFVSGIPKSFNIEGVEIVEKKRQ